MRIIQNIACRAVSGQGYAAMRPCAQIDSDGVLPQSVTEQVWPDCAAYFTGGNSDQQVLVRADYHGLPIEVNVAISIVSGASASVALFLHAMGVEIYVSTDTPHLSKKKAGERDMANETDLREQLQLTPAESERLRQVSYRKQSACRPRYLPRAGSTGHISENSAKSNDKKAEIGSDFASMSSSEAGARR